MLRRVCCSLKRTVQEIKNVWSGKENKWIFPSSSRNCELNVRKFRSFYMSFNTQNDNKCRKHYFSFITFFFLSFVISIILENWSYFILTTIMPIGHCYFVRGHVRYPTIREQLPLYQALNFIEVARKRHLCAEKGSRSS